MNTKNAKFESSARLAKPSSDTGLRAVAVPAARLATGITLGVCACLSLLGASGYAAESGPPPAVPVAVPKTHTLPTDASATVISFNYSGGMRKPENDDPLMVIRADGSVTLGDHYHKNARIKTRVTKDDLQALLQLAIDTNDFFKLDAAEIKHSLDVKLKHENEQLKDQGIISIGPDGICDAATTVVRIQADGKDHEVQYYALDMQAQADERLARLQTIATRLTELERKLRAEAAKPPVAEAPIAAPPGAVPIDTEPHVMRRQADGSIKCGE
ncbi:MAG: hypothetical protein NTW21_14190 [Verrucomicrobia bacterium]|nr:hypothetical protein [Verrucomicrobiota bacterium]